MTRYATNARRRALLDGLLEALRSLRAAGCRTAYLGGSFVTAKELPGDFDACWEVAGVDVGRIDPELLDFSDRRAAQKARYGGELFPAEVTAGVATGNEKAVGPATGGPHSAQPLLRLV